MSRVYRVFKAISLLAKRPYLINEILNNEARYRDKVRSKYQYEIGLSEVTLFDLNNGSDSFPDIDPYAFLDGGSLPTDLMLLKILCQRFQDTSYFEIGTWRGESVANVSPVCKSCITLNLPDEIVSKHRNGKEMLEQLRFFSKDLNNVKHLQGDSGTFDFIPYEKQYDVVFIDGDHTYEMVKHDTEKAYKLLKSTDSIMVWHDYAHNPGTTRWDVFLGILEGLPQSEHQNLYAVRNTKCAILFRGEIDHSEPVQIDTPKSVFHLKITAD